MGHKDKHKKEKSHKHSKRHKKEKSRKRDRSESESGSDSEEERARLKAEKKARKVEEYWNKQASRGGQSKFVWGKKIERDLLAGKDIKEFTAAALQRKHEERMAEIDKVQKRREEREAEKERMEEELAMLQRQRLAAEAVEQEQKEEEFHLQQAQVRAARRLAQGRAKPIDWLVQDLYGSVDDDGGSGLSSFRNDEADDSEEERDHLRRQVEGTMDDWAQSLGGPSRRPNWRDERDRYAQPQEQRRYVRPRNLATEPYQVMFGLTKDDLQELHDEIKGYQELELRVTPLNAEYWGCLLTLAEHELEAHRRREEADKAAGGHSALTGAYGSSTAHARYGYRGEEQQAAQQVWLRPVGAPLPGSGGPGGVHGSVQRDIEVLLAGQGYGQLQAMEADITRQLAAGEGDPEYWEAVLPRLKIYAAKARLRELKSQMLEARLAAQEEKLDVAAAMGWADEAEEEADKAQRRLGEAVPFPAGAAHITQEGDVPLSDGDEEPQPKAAPRHPDEEFEAQAEAEAAGGSSDDEAEPWQLEAAERRALSPPPVSAGELASGELEVVSADEDARLLELMRTQVRIQEAEKYMSGAELAARGAAAAESERRLHEQMLEGHGSGQRGAHPMMRQVAGNPLETGVGGLGLGRPAEQLDEATRRFREQALKAMGADEGDRNFGCEVPVEAQGQAQWWHNRYAPRKPKYFNRIHTGYEWNKYNQTHYDTENPPPKVVQGYKFNIFYPELLDRTQPPTYRVEADPTGSKDTCILVFSAGPPYEDIAFRIVNKEWETTHRRGFKCMFDRGILHLYFNFKRARYRR